MQKNNLEGKANINTIQNESNEMSINDMIKLSSALSNTKKIENELTQHNRIVNELVNAFELGSDILQ